MTTYKTEKHTNLFIIFTLTLSLIFSGIAESFLLADEVRDDCLRLHVIAESDSEADQNVKLLVRDAVLAAGTQLFCDNDSSTEAVKKISENKKMLEDTANKVLEENGFSYKAKISIENEYFETRQYEDIKLPAGEYTACKIILGEGEGKNWWCVMFPPLCLPAATKKDESIYAVFGEDGANFIKGENGFKVKFKIVEIVEEWLSKL